MRFANYIYLIILCLYIGYLIFMSRRQAKGKASLLFSSTRPFAGISESRALRFQSKIKYLKSIALIFILIALSRPQIADVEKESETFGVDIILTLDVSGSMLAEDFKPNNRLFVAKEVLKEFISQQSMDRLGLVVFAGKSYTHSPLTTDYSILLNILDEVEVNHTDGGTAIGMAISESLNRLKSSNAKSKIVILLTDGENNKGSIDPVLSAKLAKAIGVRVYTIGIGTDSGVAVPIAKGAYNEMARASDGSLVISRLNENVLKDIAAITKSGYYRATDRDSLSKIYEEIAKLEKSKIEMTRYYSYFELFPYFAFVALILIFAEIILTTTRYSTFP